MELNKEKRLLCQHVTPVSCVEGSELESLLIPKEIFFSDLQVGHDSLANSPWYVTHVVEVALLNELTELSYCALEFPLPWLRWRAPWILGVKRPDLEATWPFRSISALKTGHAFLVSSSLLTGTCVCRIVFAVRSRKIRCST